jgi:hypothetical protein
MNIAVGDFVADGPGQRVMTISVGGATIATAFDIFAAAGAKHKAVAVPIAGTIGDGGTLPITITGLHGAPAIISGFEFYENNPGPGAFDQGKQGGSVDWGRRPTLPLSFEARLRDRLLAICRRREERARPRRAVLFPRGRARRRDVLGHQR